MNDEMCFLITVLDGDTLLKCAMKVPRELLSGDCAEYPMEPENREILHSMLPDYVGACGPIVDVQNIFEITIKSDAD